MTDEKAEAQFDIYRENQRQIAKTNSLKELENNIKEIKTKKKGKK